MKEKEYIVSVTGYSRIFVKPNYFTIDVSLGCISDTMDNSLKKINKDMTSLYRLAESVGIKKEIVNVVDLNFDLEYEWKKNTYIFVGYKVEQQVTIEMDVTSENETMAKIFISRISGLLSNMKQCKINYNLKNKKEHLKKVRELAFLDAQEKAEQYTKLANIKIVGTNTISDIEPIQQYSRNNAPYECDSLSGSGEDTSLPNGKKIVLESKVFVVFDIGKK
ncbi:SIMPL domain-containing protein [Mangrovibacterium marinum]|nr:SIMPL domain-containing protein [Mangrovibacterium marinum]